LPHPIKIAAQIGHLNRTPDSRPVYSDWLTVTRQARTKKAISKAPCRSKSGLKFTGGATVRPQPGGKAKIGKGYCQTEEKGEAVGSYDEWGLRLKEMEQEKQPRKFSRFLFYLGPSRGSLFPNHRLKIQVLLSHRTGDPGDESDRATDHALVKFMSTMRRTQATTFFHVNRLGVLPSLD